MQEHNIEDTFLYSGCSLQPHGQLHYAAPADPSCWRISTYLLLAFFFAACDRGRPIGGGGMLPGPGGGVLGIDAISLGTRLDRVRMGALAVGDVLRSIADAVRGGGA